MHRIPPILVVALITVLAGGGEAPMTVGSGDSPSGRPAGNARGPTDGARLESILREPADRLGAEVVP